MRIDFILLDFISLLNPVSLDVSASISAIMHEASFPSSELFSNLTQTRGFGSLSSPLIYRLSSEDSASIHEEFELDSMPPIICLEHIWQEDEVAARYALDQLVTLQELCLQTFVKVMIFTVFERQHHAGLTCFFANESAILKINFCPLKVTWSENFYELHRRLKDPLKYFSYLVSF